ncbi:hypothetical protein JWG42_12415 [Desulfoprunum benzoelyticum]|uniref:DUF3570 domain-containing protein n=1 Tax=Desulfoprunum benzoelyticum TaxID=1506996 RepID=A0A840URB4_9BACT|nr:hypothetical protein [Desulfoprunum benzoelyticum]MBB5347366.1 hypothetical protein [Desulfoprunum benzoelyticum]MBM9530955.1 hypothetical protein [Desulfoprunum benzoelyticum]
MPRLHRCTLDWTTLLRRISPKPPALSLLILCGLIPFITEPATAQTTDPTAGQEPTLFDSAQQRTSVAVVDAAQWLDQFFYDEAISQEENRTRIRFELSSGYTRFEEFEIKPKISGRIHLPNLNKKLNILITAADDEEFSADDNPISALPRHQGAENREISAALQYFLRESPLENISATLGASFDYLYAGIRYRRSHDLDSWQGRLVNRLNYYTDDEWEDKISYEIWRPLGEKWIFRTKATVTWHVEEDGLPHSLVFAMFQKINDEKALRYEIGNYFDTEDSYEMTDLQFRVRYRQRFLRDWLVLEIAPQVGFPEDHDREVNPGIIVSLEADTGNLAGTKVFPRIFNF